MAAYLHDQHHLNPPLRHTGIGSEQVPILVAHDHSDTTVEILPNLYAAHPPTAAGKPKGNGGRQGYTETRRWLGGSSHADHRLMFEETLQGSKTAWD